jgi:signal recognition particle subunit SRP54
MFERLTDRFKMAFRGLVGRGRLTETNISDAMNEIRRALLEADVNYHVAKDFISEVRQACMGEAVMKSITPGQQAVKIVHDRLVELLGESTAPLDLVGKPAVIMLCGLHGSGKTTTGAKLALLLRDKAGRKPMLAACDLQRPAAIDQLEILGRELGVPVHTDRLAKDVAQVAVDARNHAVEMGCDVLLLDTAGRLEIDAELVQELVEVKRRAQPQEILLVADAALGQEAVSVARHFDEALGISGIVLTKLDGDARGGAALSMRKVTGKPIKFVGVGERIQDLEPFHPDRMAGRILGMGDVVSLVEKAAEQYEATEAAELQEKLREATFNFEDFIGQLGKIRKMGGVMSLMKMLPGASGLADGMDVDEAEFGRIEGIINSMTRQERRQPEILGTNRRQRIARGSGVTLVEVNQLIKQFTMMRTVMAKLGRGGNAGMLSGLGGLMGGGGGLAGLMGGGGGGMPGMGAMGGGARSAGPSATKAKKGPRKKHVSPAAMRRKRGR